LGIQFMRIVKNPQMQLGEVNISEIKFDPRSRDDIPQILKGLQFIYTNETIRKEVFKILEKNILPKINKNNGRPGMELWKIFVMGVLRLDLNYDYDQLHGQVNNHITIRQMLGHGIFDYDSQYHLQTIKDNVSLLTPELLDEINQVIVKAGHILLKKKGSDLLRGRCDSFVVETNVHFPTDINLLFDAMRKVITLLAELCERHGLSDWRQHDYNVRQVKRLMRTAQNKKRARAKTEEQKKKRDTLIAEAHQEYIDVAQKYLDKACHTLNILEKRGLSDMKDVLLIENIRIFINHGVRQINQIERRVIFGEIIPHDEKVFSLFQPHTEWVMKGKAGVPVELGVKVCVMEDHDQFILHHMVMEKKTDDEIAVPMVDETKKRFPNFSTCSFDKGFHSPNNQKELNEKLDVVALKRKGRLSQQARAIEHSEEFLKARHKHSAVESAINALEVHGLDMCPDHGIDGFKRYVALAIVARNIHRIGAILKNREQKIEERRREKYLNRYDTFKLAA
jgi:IS5 family transposase